MDGNIQFTYSSTQNKAGDSVSSNRTWTEQYGATLGASVLDPRFLQLFAGVNYSVSHQDNLSGQEFVAYNVNGMFFPGRMISWNLYDSKSVTNVPSTKNIAGYDVETTSLGGVMMLNLSKGFKKSNNNNNYYNNWNNGGNNNAGRKIKLQFPDITLSAVHTEALSRSEQNPLHEIRDNTGAIVFYRPLQSTDIRFEGKTEAYENVLSGNSYDIKTMDLFTTARLTQQATLDINGRHTERQFSNLLGGGTASNGLMYEAKLSLHGKNRLYHSYYYSGSRYESEGSETTGQSGGANMTYLLLPELSLVGNAGFLESESLTAGTTTTPAQRNNVQSSLLSLGARYTKEHRPELLDPFILRTTYSLDSGMTNVTDSASDISGNGLYYSNEAGIGLFSSGWKKETIGTEYSYSSGRDHSPLHRNRLSHQYRLSFSTSRIPDSNLRANLDYSLNEVSSSPFSQNLLGTTTTTAANNESRSLLYGLHFDHTVASWLNFSARASRQKTRMTTTYSLASASAAETPEVTTQVLGATLNASYSVSRVLSLRGSANADFTRQQPVGSQTAMYLQTAGFDWQLRQINITGDFRRYQIVPETGLRTEQRMVYLRASRRF